MEEHLYAHLYEVEQTHWWYAERQEILLAYIDARLRPGPSTRVLDAGCGAGAILEKLARRFDASGMDLSPTAIEFCRRRGLGNLFAGRLEDYPAGAPFDLVTMFDMVEHVDDDGGLLRSAHALLREGGHLLVTVPAFPFLWSAHDLALHHKRRYTRRALAGLVRGAGFSIVHLSFFNALLFPVAVLKRAADRLTGATGAPDLEVPPEPLNSLLRRVFALERPLLCRRSLPVGLSLICLARRTD